MGRRIVILNWMDPINPSSGGAERYCYEMGKRLAKNNYEVFWISRKFRNGTTFEKLDNIQIIRVGNRFTVYLLALIKTHFLNPDWIFDSINAIPFFTPFLRNSNKFAMVHHIIPKEVIKSKIGPLSLIAEFVQFKLVPVLYRNTVTFANSDSTEHELKHLGFKRIQSTRLGVEIPEKAEPEIKENIILAPGALRPWKRPDHIIRAFSKLNIESKLILFGRPESERLVSDLENLVKSLSVSDKVQIKTNITENEKMALYRSSKLAVIASEKEGWGFSAIEPQAYGCPVIAYDVPGIRDSVLNNKTGILVKNGDIDDLSKTIAEVMEKEIFYNALSKNALSWAKSLSWENSYNDFLNTMQSLSRSGDSLML